MQSSGLIASTPARTGEDQNARGKKKKKKKKKNAGFIQETNVEGHLHVLVQIGGHVTQHILSSTACGAFQKLGMCGPLQLQFILSSTIWE